MRAGGRWPAVMAVIAMLALLGAFERVVRHAVQQGALRRAAVVEKADATWRCNHLQGRRAQSACRVALL